MPLLDVMGLMTGLVGFSLAAAGLALALLASIRMLWVVRKPNKGRIARGIAVAGLVLFLCGALLFTVQEVDTPALKAASDRSAYYLAAAAVLLAVFVGYRSARRRPVRAKRAEPAERAAPVEPAAPQGPATPEPPQASQS